MGAHGGKPLQNIKGLCLPAFFCLIDNLRFIPQIGHALLRERGPDDEPGKVLQGRSLMRIYPAAAEHGKPGMLPGIKHADQVSGNLSFEAAS